MPRLSLARRRGARTASRPVVELLEGRQLLATITVTGTGDTIAVDGVVTLREAITAANRNAVSGDAAAGEPGLDTIAFNIPGAGVRTIRPAADLPAITEQAVVDGFSQPGARPNSNPLNLGINAVLLIELDGRGLAVNASGSVVKGLNIHGLGDEITVNASRVTIAGNFLGTIPAGTAEGPDDRSGFGIRQESGDNNVFGGPAAADRNLISGDRQGAIFLASGDGTLIQGNSIGTDVTGTVALNAGAVSQPGITGNGMSNTTIVGNLITGSGDVAVDLQGGGRIQGNLIGTRRDGASPLGNNGGLNLGSGFLVGGTGPGQGNTIAFNRAYGVHVKNNESGVAILGNSLYANGSKGISLTDALAVPLANDPSDPDVLPGNRGQNYPVLTSVAVAGGNVTISGTLNSTPGTTFRVEFFSNAAADPSGSGEGQTFLGSAGVTTDGHGDASFGPLVFAVPAGQAVFSATATDPVGGTSEFSAARTVAVAAVPADLGVGVAGAPDPVRLGQDLTYTITVTNRGPGEARDVELRDIPPAGTTLVSFAAPAGWTATEAPGGVTATAPRLAAGASARFTIVRAVAVPAFGYLEGAHVAAATDDPDTTNDMAIWATRFLPTAADLRVTIAGAPDAVRLGQDSTYAITVTNPGPDEAFRVRLVEVLPDRAKFVSLATPAGWTMPSPSPGGFTSTAPRLAAGASARFTLVVRAADPARSGPGYTDSASITATTVDPDRKNNKATRTTRIIATAADLRVTIAGGPDAVRLGQDITYTISVTNPGPDEAFDVELFQKIPEGTTLVSHAAPAGWTTETTHVGGLTLIDARTPRLASGARTRGRGRAVFTLVVRADHFPPSGPGYTDLAIIDAATEDPDSKNNKATRTTRFLPTTADLGLAVTGAPSAVRPGQDSTYAITLTNLGPDEAFHVSFVDRIPSGTRLVSFAAPAGWTTQTESNGDVTYLIATAPRLASGARTRGGSRAVFTLVVRPLAIPPVDGRYTNAATVLATTTDPVPANNSAAISTTALRTTLSRRQKARQLAGVWAS